MLSNAFKNASDRDVFAHALIAALLGSHARAVTTSQSIRKQAMNDIDLKVKAAIDQARDVFAGVKDGTEALDYLVEVLKAAPAVVAAEAATQMLVKLVVEVDTSQVDTALAKIEQLKLAAQQETEQDTITAELLSELRGLRMEVTDLRRQCRWWGSGQVVTTAGTPP